MSREIIFGIAASATAMLSGCDLAHRIYGTNWIATLDRPADGACVRDAIMSMPEVSHVETRGVAADVYLKSPTLTEAQVQESNAQLDAQMKKAGYPGYRQFADITVWLAKDSPQIFHMSYLGWPLPTDRREIIAHRIIGQVATRCNIPELSARAQENHDSMAAPSLFNM